LPVTKPTDLTEHSKIHTQKLELRRVNKLLAESVDRCTDLKRQLEIHTAIRAADSKPIRIRPGKRGPKKATTVVALISDWHTCQIVDAAEVNGLNEHNAEIGQERGTKYFIDLARCIKHEQAAYQIDEVVLWLGGDFLQNCHIHDLDSQLTVGISPQQEAGIVAPLLSGGIQHLLKSLDCRFNVVCNVGNHGRTTYKRLTTKQTNYSYEQAIYNSLALFFKDERRVRFDVGESNHKVADIAGFKILFTHGDEGLKGGGGIGGISVPFRRVITASWMPTYGVDFVCIGHYHHFVQIAEGMINGSLVGWDTYAKSMGLAFGRPQQMMFNVDHESKRVGGVRPIWG